MRSQTRSRTGWFSFSFCGTKIVSNLGVKEMLALLDALKGAVRDCAAHEEKLNGEFRAQSAAATRLSDEAIVKRTEKLAGAVDRENVEFAERKNRITKIGRPASIKPTPPSASG